MKKTDFDKRSVGKRLKSTLHVCKWCFVEFMGSSQQKFCSDSDCAQEFNKTRQKIFKIYQFSDYRSELLKLEEQGKNYVMKVKKNDESEQVDE